MEGAAQGGLVSIAALGHANMTSSPSCRIVAVSIWAMVLFGLGLRLAEHLTGLASAAVVVAAAAPSHRRPP